jgi:hypothetical protein
MTAEFEQSTTLDLTPDPLDLFLLGKGKMAQKKYADATAAFEKCSQVTWAWQANCKAQLEESKKLTPPPTTPTLVKP